MSILYIEIAVKIIFGFEMDFMTQEDFKDQNKNRYIRTVVAVQSNI